MRQGCDTRQTPRRCTSLARRTCRKWDGDPDLTSEVLLGGLELQRNLYRVPPCGHRILKWLLTESQMFDAFSIHQALIDSLHASSPHQCSHRHSSFQADQAKTTFDNMKTVSSGPVQSRSISRVCGTSATRQGKTEPAMTTLVASGSTARTMHETPSCETARLHNPMHVDNQREHPKHSLVLFRGPPLSVRAHDFVRSLVGMYACLQDLFTTTHLQEELQIAAEAKLGMVSHTVEKQDLRAPPTTSQAKSAWAWLLLN